MRVDQNKLVFCVPQKETVFPTGVFWTASSMVSYIGAQCGAMKHQSDQPEQPAITLARMLDAFERQVEARAGAQLGHLAALQAGAQQQTAILQVLVARVAAVESVAPRHPLSSLAL